MDALNALFPCFPHARNHTVTEKQQYGRLSTKSSIEYSTSDSEKISNIHRLESPANPPTLSTQEAASSIVSVLQTADSTNPSPDVTIKSLVHQAGGWSQYLAEAVLWALEAVLKAGVVLVGAMKEAYDKACEAAKVIKAFAIEHPLATEVFVTVIALGMLVILLPYVLEALGFAALGPVEGSWAALWQATYRGLVPKGSLFSYFQRLGMKVAAGGWAASVQH